MSLDNKHGAAGSHQCSQHGHVWGDPYSFGGVKWYRDCIRCFEGEEVASKGSASGVFALDAKVVPLRKTGS